jgi:4-hydroxy-tetrahydrodipicolinate reductase
VSNHSSFPPSATASLLPLLLLPLQNQIRKIRDRVTQLEAMAVPEDALDGHAFHTYTLKSQDQSVEFVFKHNVTGRSIYAEGTVDAVLFLAKKMQEGAQQKVYNMIDVLREGFLR